MTKITYHKSHSFKDKEGKEHNFITQLYQIGVYGILDSNPQTQSNFEPSQIVKAEKNLKKQEEKGKITELKFGIPITVTKDESGLWKEVT